MASDQRTRKGDINTAGREVGISQEEHVVPKMTTHFESLAVEGKDSDLHKGREEESRVEKSGQEAGHEPSLEETTRLRQTAQQNSAEAIRAAEERYNQVKETAAQKAQQAKETVVHGAQQAKATAAQKAQQAKELAAQKAEEVKGPTAEKSEQAKGTVSQAKEYVVEKAVEAKDATVEKVAVAKDKAAAAGWTAGHYTTEKTVEGTKAAAGAVKGAAEYVGSKAAELVNKPLGAAKEAAVSTGESIKDYTARKKEEAEKELEAKKGPATETQGTERSYWEGEEEDEPRRSRQSSTAEDFQDEQERSERKGGGVIGAIRETIVEIAETTKEYVVGKSKHGSEERGGLDYEEK